jgi:hypothetical protein
MGGYNKEWKMRKVKDYKINNENIPIYFDVDTKEFCAKTRDGKIYEKDYDKIIENVDKIYEWEYKWMPVIEINIKTSEMDVYTFGKGTYNQLNMIFSFNRFWISFYYDKTVISKWKKKGKEISIFEKKRIEIPHHIDNLHIVHYDNDLWNNLSSLNQIIKDISIKIDKWMGIDENIKILMLSSNKMLLENTIRSQE